MPPIVEIFADFLRYLHQCARNFIEETHVNGVDLWSSLEDSIEFVLSHPNGRECAQQSKMRTAAVHAGLISDDQDGHSRLSFITEGEASLHFCLQNGLTNDAIKVDFIQSCFFEKISLTPWLQSGKGLIIVDAGGGTIDISAYRRTSLSSQSYEEIAAPQCTLLFFSSS